MPFFQEGRKKGGIAGETGVSFFRGAKTPPSPGSPPLIPRAEKNIAVRVFSGVDSTKSKLKL